MILVEDLAFAYPRTSEPVLNGVSFSLAPGEVFGLLGPSGAGKSTTQKILMGMLPGFRGRAEVFGAPIASVTRDFYERIGVSFELPALYLRLTALENLRLFAALYRTHTRDLMEVLSLVELAEDAHKRVEQFSKGMKLRLNFARALLHDPELLFLDEPTMGQDPARSRLIRTLIRRQQQEGKTVFLTTHNMQEAEEICDRVAFLAGGRIVVTGSPAELKRRYGRSILHAAVSSAGGIASHTFPMEGLGANDEFLALLRSGSVLSLHTLEATLDEIFIKLTRPDSDGAQS